MSVNLASDSSSTYCDYRRYAFIEQPNVALWNLHALCASLAPLFAPVTAPTEAPTTAPTPIGTTSGTPIAIEAPEIRSNHNQSITKFD